MMCKGDFMDTAIIFDLDGTVLYTDELIKRTFIKVFEKYQPGYTLSEDELLSFLGPSLKETFSKYFPDEMFNELLNYYHSYNHSHHEDFAYVYPTVVETLEYLKNRGYPLGIVTTKLKVAADVGLNAFDLKKYFDVVIGLDDVKVTKPDPEGIVKAMELLGVKKAVYIGDNITDIQAGKNAGIKTIGVKWSPKGYQHLLELEPDLMIDEMKEIIPYIEGAC